MELHCTYCGGTPLCLLRLGKLTLPILEWVAYTSPHLVTKRAGRGRPGTQTSLDPPPPVGARLSPRAAPGHRGVDWPERARVPDFTHSITGTPGSPGFASWVCYLPSPIRATVELCIHPPPLGVFMLNYSCLTSGSLLPAPDHFFELRKHIVGENALSTALEFVHRASCNGNISILFKVDGLPFGYWKPSR